MATKKAKLEPQNLTHYLKLMEDLPGVEVKGATMPYTSLNGNMFSFLKEGVVALRLPEKERAEFLKKYRSKLFEAYGAIMKEYVIVPAELLKDPKKLRLYVVAGHGYAKTLKAKLTKKK